MATKTKPSDQELTREQIIAEARAEAAQIIAEAKAQAVAQSEPAKSKEEPVLSDEYLKEKVTIRLFKDGRDYRDDVFVSGGIDNGFLIQRGVDVEVPRYIKLILDDALAQSGVAAQVSEEYQKTYEERSREMGIG